MKLAPVLKSALWGGTRLSSFWGKGEKGKSVAESWELSVREQERNWIVNGALAGIIVGFAVDALWYMFMGWSNIYEIIPGFFAGMIAAVVVSLLSAKPNAEVLALFEKSRKPTED